MRPRSLLVLLFTNILVAVAVSVAFLNVMGTGTGSMEVTRFATFVVVVTATRNPNETPQIRIVTATPQPGQVFLPTEVTGELGTTNDDLDETSEADAPETTIDPSAFEANPELEGTVNALPEGCITHTLAEGEFPSLLAETYGTDTNSILLVNELTEEDAAFLQVGQVLIIPLEGCELLNAASTAVALGITPEEPEDETTDAGEPTDEATPEVTTESTPTPTITPTITLMPTATDAQVEIVRVEGAGDVTAEQVLIRNNGRVINLNGWTLSDAEGNTYIFAERNLFTNGEITIRTGEGDDTPVILFWDQTVPVFGEAGDVAVLKNAAGEVQAVLRLESPIDLD